MRSYMWLAIAPFMLGMGACDSILGASDGPELVAAANSTLQSGDLPAAAAEYEQLAADNPDSVFVAIGRSYFQLLEGDYEGADATLAHAEANAGEKLGEVKLRRALVALRAGDLDQVKTHGTDSGLPAGKLLAAEVHLVDLESTEAVALLKEISGSDPVGATASTYVQMLDSGDQIQAGLAEATALWGLGDRGAACEAAEELVKALDTDDKNEQLMLWAGRAVTSNKLEVTSSLLDELESNFPPPELQWRILATRAMLDIAQGQPDKGMKTLQLAAQLDGAPADGLMDAFATAAALAQEKEVALKIAGNVESAAGARGLMEAGAVGKARAKAPEGFLKTYLENQ
jgi:tetratricopeptide (TPR) repeat protein